MKNKSSGIAFLCNAAGVIVRVEGNINITAEKDFINQPFSMVFQEPQRSKAASFIVQLRLQATLFDWLMDIPLNGKLSPFYFSGICGGGYSMIVGSLKPFNLFRQFQDHLEQLEFNNRQINQLYSPLEEERDTQPPLAPHLPASETETERLRKEINLLRRELEFKNNQIKEDWSYFSITLASIGDAVIATDLQGRVKFMNQVAESITDWQEEKARGIHLSEIFDIKGQAFGSLQEVIALSLEQGERAFLGPETKLISKTNWEIPIDGSIAPIRNETSQTYGLVLVFRDITEHKVIENSLRESQQLIQRIMETNPNLIYILDLSQKRYIYSNRDMALILGYTPEESVKFGTDIISKLIHPEDIHILGRNYIQYRIMKDGDILESEYRLKHKSNDWRWIIARDTVFKRATDGTPLEILGTSQDITERKQAEDTVKQMAIRDGLTEIYNHREFYRLLALEFERASRYDRNFSLLMGDIDYFKHINDTYGHLAGDETLRAIAKILLNELRAVDKIARYGGEEFACLIPETDSQGGYEVAERLRSSIEKASIKLPGGELLSITISFGVVSFSEGFKQIEEMVGAVDNALYESKHNGRNRVTVFHKTSDLPSRE